MQFISRRARIARLLATTLFVAPAAQAVMPAHGQSIGRQHGGNMELLPTGVFISPTAIPGSNQQFLNPQLSAFPDFIAGEAVKSALSPDGNTLAIITSGYNKLFAASGATAVSTQFLFIYDVSGANKATPKLTQVIQQTNAFVGLVWNGNTTLYVSGGPDDRVYVYTRAGAAPATPFAAAGSVPFNHLYGSVIGITANTSGLALSADGKILVADNFENDSICVIETASNTLAGGNGCIDLRPYSTSGQNGVAGGEYPWAVAVKGNTTAFISSVRDREVVVVDVSTPASPKFVTRIPLAGNAYGMTLSPDQSKLFVAQENSDQTAVIDTVSYAVVKTIDTRAPAGVLGSANDHDNGNHYGQDKNGDPPHYTGAEPIAVTVSPDGKTLYAVNNGNNSIAVIPLTGKNAYTVAGMIPTAYAPKDITFSADGSQMYIINGLSNTGPNPGWPTGAADIGALGPNGAVNEYSFQLERASLVSAPVPRGHVLDELTTQVAKNNHYSMPVPRRDTEVMNFLHDKIKHVIFVVKENRTFDQVLGDLNNGSNGDPSLTAFGAAITPNLHSLAKNFVTLDNFMDPGDATSDGWCWVMRSGVTTTEEISQQNVYAFRARDFDDVSDYYNRDIPVELLTTAERNAATNGGFASLTASRPGGTSNALPGPANVADKDAPFGYQKSYIFEAVLNAGGTVRNYGWMALPTGPISAGGAPISNPYAVGAVQVAELNETLADGRTDLYFRGWDMNYPDTWRFQEWNREFQQYEANGQLPSLSLVRMGTDHMGNFGTEVAGLNTPEKQVADNDYAVGKLIETVAHSPRYSHDTLVIVVEDDSQDGPDHVDSHRAPAYIAGPYVKQGAVVSTFYTLVSVLRTIEDILGTEHMSLNTAYARPMSDVFDIRQSPVWTFNAVASTALQGTGLQVTLNDLGVKYAEGPVVKSTHDVAYWTEATRGFDFSKEDRVPPALFNKVLWKGLMADKPFPAPHSAFQTVRADDDDDK